MKRTDDSMKFDVELGKRLRELRLRAGLTQDALAVAMGRDGKRAGNHVGELELGRKQQPSLAFVADFLRACRAEAADIADLLDRYIKRPAVLDVRVRAEVRRVAEHLPPYIAKQSLNYDLFHEVPADRTLPGPDQVARRLLRFKRYAARAAQREMVNKVLRKVVGESGARPGLLTDRMLFNRGHKYFALLRKLRRATAKRRDAALVEFEDEAVMETGLPQEAIQYVLRAVRREFDAMEADGALDWLPDVKAEDLPAEGAKPPSQRQIAQAQAWARAEARQEWARVRAELVEQVWDEAQPQLTGAGVESRVWPSYRGLVAEVCSVVDHNEPASDGWAKGLEAAATNGRRMELGQDPAIARVIARFVADRYEVLRRTMSNHPLGWVRETEG
jgi:transcriptional regulator with XRE-family HTH domain